MLVVRPRPASRRQSSRWTKPVKLSWRSSQSLSTTRRILTQSVPRSLDWWPSKLKRWAPDLVTRNEEGKAYAVRYEAANAMLLNEFLKEHRNVQQLEETVAQQRNDFQAINEQQQKEFESKIAQQQKQIEALNAAVQKADAQLESSGRALHAIANNH